MVTRRTLAGYGITTYRCRLALTNDEWARLRAEAARNNVSGERLIEQILQDVCAALPAPAAEVVAEEPPPEAYQDMVEIV